MTSGSWVEAAATLAAAVLMTVAGFTVLQDLPATPSDNVARPRPRVRQRRRTRRAQGRRYRDAARRRRARMTCDVRACATVDDRAGSRKRLTAVEVPRTLALLPAYPMAAASPRRQMPAMRHAGLVVARIEMAAVLLRALQDDRPRRVGERALSREDVRGARVGRPDRRSRRRVTRQSSGHACRRIAMPCAPCAIAVSRSLPCSAAECEHRHACPPRSPPRIRSSRADVHRDASASRAPGP